MNNEKIEYLNTNLVLHEVRIDLVLEGLKYYSTLTDNYSNNQFRSLLSELLHFKNSYNEVYNDLQKELNFL